MFLLNKIDHGKSYDAVYKKKHPEGFLDGFIFFIWNKLENDRNSSLKLEESNFGFKMNDWTKKFYSITKILFGKIVEN